MFLQPSGRKMYVYNLLGLGEYKSQVDGHLRPCYTKLESLYASRLEGKSIAFIITSSSKLIKKKARSAILDQREKSSKAQNTIITFIKNSSSFVASPPHLSPLNSLVVSPSSSSLQTQRVLSSLFLATDTLRLLGSLVHLFTLGVSSVCDSAYCCADGREAFVESVA